MTTQAMTLNHSDKASRWMLWSIVAFLVSFIAWAYVAELDEVAVGEGKVTPSQKGQVVQSLEGGILSELLVREGDVVERDQVLASLDQSAMRSMVGENASKVHALSARATRVRAEMEDRDSLVFPDDVKGDENLVRREQELFDANRAAFQQNRDNLQTELALAEKELSIVLPLVKQGATNDIEIIKLRQKVAELTTKLAAMKSEYYVNLKKEYSEVMSELEPLVKIGEGRADQLRRTVIKSPARGIVKDVHVSTIGGVVPPGGELLEIIPLDDKLLIEARLSPCDIAFIHPEQEATVKITAYDSSIYGTLHAKVDRISPDAFEDQRQPGVFYYRAYVVTDNAYLETHDGIRHPIIPGMVATTEIRTGRKTVLEYLLKPINKAGEALRER
jgi:adhesin transport system membrane fusion protein